MTELHPHPLAEDSPFPLLLISPDEETILWVNQAAQEWLGKSKRHLIGLNPWKFIKIEEGAQGIIGKCRKGRSPLTIRDARIMHQGETQLYHITAYPTEAGIGLNLARSGRQPQAGRLGGELVSGMGRMIAHELKNPLAGIKGAAQLLRDDIDTAEGLDLLDLISSEIDRIRRLADRMETLGDQDPDNTEQVNIHELLRQARRVIQSANPDLIFTERYDPSLPMTTGDADTLMQALLNLIKNASEAIENNTDNGEITLETRFRAGVRNGRREGPRHLPIEIRIIDNGPGVPPELIHELFQPFVTTKADGQGLGLALVSKVARAHGGLVEVNSAPGHTEFSLLLPTS